MDMLKIENEYWKKGYKYIAGIDEAGRGPLAGPVVAACVIFDKKTIIEGIKDSKKLSIKKRSELFDVILKKALSVGVGIVESDIIDKVNILEATYIAFKKALGSIKIKADLVLIDGPRSNIKHYKVLHIINGDNLSQCIAAASIIAKVTRDNLMKEYDKIFNIYNFSSNKGYGTKYHCDILKQYKASLIHRKSFKIVGNNLPTIKYIENSYGFKTLGFQLGLLSYIQTNYKIIDTNININSDVIDCLLISTESQLLFVKFITTMNNAMYSNGKVYVSDYSIYLPYLSNYLEEKELSNNFKFNIISLSINTKNKPILKTLYNNEN